MNSDFVIQLSLLILSAVYLQFGNYYFNRINAHFVKTGDAHLVSTNPIWWAIFCVVWPIFFFIGLWIGMKEYKKNNKENKK